MAARARTDVVQVLLQLAERRLEKGFARGVEDLAALAYDGFHQKATLGTALGKRHELSRLHEVFEAFRSTGIRAITALVIAVDAGAKLALKALGKSLSAERVRLRTGIRAVDSISEHACEAICQSLPTLFATHGRN